MRIIQYNQENKLKALKKTEIVCFPGDESSTEISVCLLYNIPVEYLEKCKEWLVSTDFAFHGNKIDFKTVKQEVIY